MNIGFEFQDGELRAILSGTADSLQSDPDPGETVAMALRSLDEQVTVKRPERISVDFRGLTYIDSTSFRKIAEDLDLLRKRRQVVLTGPGEALGRLFALIEPPVGWTWSSGDRKADPPPEIPTVILDRLEGEGIEKVDEAETEEVSKSEVERALAVDDIFEIDLDRELFLLGNEPPAPEYDPMAEPLDLVGGAGWAAAAPDPTGHPPGQPVRPVPGPGTTQAPPPDSAAGLSGGAGPGEVGPPGEDKKEKVLPESGEARGGSPQPLAGEIPEVEDSLESPVEEDLLADRCARLLSLDEFPEDVDALCREEPPASKKTSAGHPVSGDVRGAVRGQTPEGADLARGLQEARLPREVFARREELLKDLLIDSILAGDYHRFRAEAPETRKEERSESGPGSFQGRAAEKERSGPGEPSVRGLSPISSPEGPAGPLAGAEKGIEIPAFLRGDIPRPQIVRAFSRILERKRARKEVPESAIFRIARAIVACVRQAPYASFDLAAARPGAPAATRAVYTTAMALCMASRAKAREVRLRSLAILGLLTSFPAPPGGKAPEIPMGDGAIRALARKLHGKVLAVLGESPGEDPLREIAEAEVREDLRLLALVQEYWRRIGAGSDGDGKPASAAIALARGEIGRQAPPRLRRLFLETFSIFPPGTWVRLESGEVGVVVAPGSRSIDCPLVLISFSGGDRELRPRPPRLVETGLERVDRVRAVVRCPIQRCRVPRYVLRAGDFTAPASPRPGACAVPGRSRSSIEVPAESREGNVGETA